MIYTIPMHLLRNFNNYFWKEVGVIALRNQKQRGGQQQNSFHTNGSASRLQENSLQKIVAQLSLLQFYRNDLEILFNVVKSIYIFCILRQWENN